MALRLLEASVRARLRSGVAITSMAQCVEELVQNCIDAGATCVAVRVDVCRFKLQVVDNGTGISSNDLKLVGERYATSKCHSLSDLDNLEYFGFRGEALASIVDVSGTVEICSRHKLSQQSHSKVFHRGRAVSISPNKNPRPSVGTTVTVHDFFYNLPVRRIGLSEALELNHIRKVVECIALVNPSRSFSVRNDKSAECILQTHKTHSILSTFGLICGAEKASCMKEVALNHGDFKFTGFIGTDGHHSKSLQFIYVNGRSVKKTPLHACVNGSLANSIIARKLSRQNDPGWQPRGLQLDKDLFSPKRTPERHGVYILMIECPRTEYDICLEPAKTLIEFRMWDSVLNAVDLLVRKFLEEYNLTLGPIAPDESSKRNATDSETASHCTSQLLETSPSQDVSKFLGGELNFDLEFRNAVQSKVIRRRPLERSTRAPDLEGDKLLSETNYADQFPSSSKVLSSQPSDPSSLTSSPGMGGSSDEALYRSARFEVDSLTREGDSLKGNLQENLKSVPAGKESLDNPEHSLANIFQTESIADSTTIAHSDTVQLSTVQSAPDPIYTSAIPTAELSHSMGTEQLCRVPRPYRVRVQPQNGGHLTTVYSQQAAVDQNYFLSSSAKVAVATQLLDPEQTHADISAIESSGEICSTAQSGKASLPASLPPFFPNSLPASSYSMPSVTVAEPVVGSALSVRLAALSGEYSNAPVSTSNCNRTLLPNYACTYSCQSHPSTQLTATASFGRNEAREAHSRPLVGLSTPVRSPLQSSSLSAKLMKLLKKGKLADKEESTGGAQVVRKSNTESELTGRLRSEGMQNDHQSLVANSAPLNSSASSSCDCAASSVALIGTIPIVSSSSTSSNASNYCSFQVSDCSQRSESSFSSLNRRQPSSPDASSNAVSLVEPTVDQTSMLDSGIFSFSDPSIEPSREYNGESKYTVVQSSHLSVCEAKSTALCNDPEPIENADHSSTHDACSSDRCTNILAPECHSHDHRLGSETNARAFNQYGSLEHPKYMYHSEVYSTSQSVFPRTGSYQMPDLSSASWIDSTYGSSQSHSVSKPQWKEATDPISRQKVYIESATGKCLSQKPTSSTHFTTSHEMDSTAGREESLRKRTHTLHSTAPTLGQCSSSSLGAPPLRAAPHLSHNFSPLLPRPKQQRTSFLRDSRADVSQTESDVSSLVAEVVTSRSNECAVDSKWRNDDELSQLKISQMNEPSSVARLLENWENPTFQPGHEDVLNIGRSGSSRSQIKVHNAIYPYKFTREMFVGIKVLGQVDDKFIACLMDARHNGTPNLLVLIDQHAAHERVRLEALTADVYEAPSAGSTATTNPRIKSSVVHPPLVLNLQPVERRLARLFRAQLETIGVSLLFRQGGVQAASIPSVLMAREASERRRGRPAVALDILQELIVKHLELLQTTAGSCFTLPSTITQVLNSQACHGAIKFGDPLTLEECQSLIQQLSHCRLPFQCAHGRPALMPILDLELLNRKYSSQEVPFPDLRNIIQESDKLMHHSV